MGASPWCIGRLCKRSKSVARESRRPPAGNRDSRSPRRRSTGWRRIGPLKVSFSDWPAACSGLGRLWRLSFWLRWRRPVCRAFAKLALIYPCSFHLRGLFVRQPYGWLDSYLQVCRCAAKYGSSRGRTHASQSRDQHRARNLFVIMQVAIALVLLICSGLMIRTSER